jgi:ATP-dependent DNA helicase DinG
MCTGQKCPNFERCFITLMHQRAAESDIIIVNHHLFFADLSLKDENYEGGILPEYTPWCSTKPTRSKTWPASTSASAISNYRFRNCGAISRHGPHEEVRHAGTGPHPAAAGRDDRAVLRPLRRGRPARGLQGRDAFREENEEIYTDLLAALELIGSHLKLLQNPPEEIIPLFAARWNSARRCAS